MRGRMASALLPWSPSRAAEGKGVPARPLGNGGWHAVLAAAVPRAPKGQTTGRLRTCPPCTAHARLCPVYARGGPAPGWAFGGRRGILCCHAVVAVDTRANATSGWRDPGGRAPTGRKIALHASLRNVLATRRDRGRLPVRGSGAGVAAAPPAAQPGRSVRARGRAGRGLVRPLAVRGQLLCHGHRRCHAEGVVDLARRACLAPAE